MFIIGVAFLALAIFISGLPGRIAIARNHPEADAVNAMGWVGFLAVVPWIQAFIWAFKPTTVIDMRNLPEEERRETAAMIERLKGEAPVPDTHRPPDPSSTVMAAAILVLLIGLAIFWLVFFKLKLLRLTPAWGFGFGLIFVHFFLIFLIGLRFVTPNSANATVVQRTIQLIPRLPEPTLVTAVLVEENMPVKKDQPLFQFDRRPYEYKVAQLEAQLAEAKQNVLVLQSNVEAATQTATRAKVELDYQQYQKAHVRQTREGAGRA